VERTRGPMNKNWIRGAADQGERAQFREALVTKGRWRKSSGRATKEIRAVYPDARLVFVHRDPMKVLLSVTKLTEVLRRPFTDSWIPNRAKT
jgi:hypothetical protein